MNKSERFLCSDSPDCLTPAYTAMDFLVIALCVIVSTVVVLLPLYQCLQVDDLRDTLKRKTAGQEDLPVLNVPNSGTPYEVQRFFLMHCFFLRFHCFSLLW